MLTWSANAAGYVLQVTDNLSTPNWQPVSQTPIIVGSDATLAITPGSGGQFYRLIHPNP